MTAFETNIDLLLIENKQLQGKFHFKKLINDSSVAS